VGLELFPTRMDDHNGLGALEEKLQGSSTTRTPHLHDIASNLDALIYLTITAT